jgi:SAM-dependent methyltransferase
MPREYALRRSAAETERLILQERVLGASTARFFQAAGIGPGMRVLDVGSGAGDVSILVAKVVGPAGSVLGVDIDEPSVQAATQRAAAAGLGNAAFVAADVGSGDLGAGLDAVVGRLVLMHLPDPALVLRRLAGVLRPGGLLAFQEAHLAAPWLSFPASASLEQVQRVRASALSGGRQPVNPYMGLALRQAFARAGLPDPEIRAELIVGGGQDWDGYDLAEATVRSLVPGWRKRGIDGAEELEPDGLAARLREEIGPQGSVMLFPLIGAWTRLP